MTLMYRIIIENMPPINYSERQTKLLDTHISVVNYIVQQIWIIKKILGFHYNYHLGYKWKENYRASNTVKYWIYVAFPVR